MSTGESRGAMTFAPSALGAPCVVITATDYTQKTNGVGYAWFYSRRAANARVLGMDGRCTHVVLDRTKEVVEVRYDEVFLGEFPPLPAEAWEGKVWCADAEVGRWSVVPRYWPRQFAEREQKWFQSVCGAVLGKDGKPRPGQSLPQKIRTLAENPFCEREAGELLALARLADKAGPWSRANPRQYWAHKLLAQIRASAEEYGVSDVEELVSAIQDGLG